VRRCRRIKWETVISQDYVALLILQNGPAKREAQEQISERIVKLLGLRSVPITMPRSCLMRRTRSKQLGKETSCCIGPQCLRRGQEAKLQSAL
jgi:hypothetical protein